MSKNLANPLSNVISKNNESVVILQKENDFLLHKNKLLQKVFDETEVLNYMLKAKLGELENNKK